MKATSKVTTYNLEIEELKELFAQQLGAQKSNVTVEAIMKTSGDDRFGTESSYFSGIKVTVTEKQ